jgi:hypothetical protein
MHTLPLLAPAPTDHLAVFIVMALGIVAVSRVMRSHRTDVKIIAICFGCPLAIALYYALSRLFRALTEGFGQLAGD